MRGVSKDASSAAIAQTLVTALKDNSVTASTTLATWDSAAADIAHIYKAAVGASPKLVRPYNP